MATAIGSHQGQIPDGREFELHDVPTEALFAVGSEDFGSIALHTPSEPPADELVVRVPWAMPVWPIWIGGTSLTTPGLVSTFVTERESGATITLWR